MKRQQQRLETAALYLRVSSPQQAADDKTSLATQEAEARAFASLHQLAIDEAHVYRETNTAEDYYERPVLLEARAAAARGEFTVLIVHCVDRLSRDPNHLLVALAELERAGVEVRFAIDSLEDTPEGKMITYIKGYAAQMENRMRKERTLRAKRERVAHGRPLPSNRPLYGYRWVDLSTKDRLQPDPVTAPIVERIFRDAASGKTLRAIAAALTAEGIPTPATYAGRKNGGAAWDPAVVHQILVHSTYWGEPRAFVTKAVHLSPQERVRGGYKHRSIRVTRPEAEQVSLPADVAPPLVERTLADEVRHRLQLNRQLASRNNHNPDATLLHGGFARCGYCGGTLAVTHAARTHKDGTSGATYQCKRPMRVKGSCKAFSIRAHLLDDAVWDTVKMLLLDPRLIAYELERKREAPEHDPAHAAVAAVDARLAELERQRTNLVKAIGLLADPDAIAPLTDQLATLTRRIRELTGERQTAAVHAERSAAQERALHQVMDWAAQVGRNVDQLTTRERREVLAALGAEVRVWRQEDRDPRVSLDLHLPVSGVLPVITEPDGSRTVCVTTVTGKIQKYLMRQQSIGELGLSDAANIQTA